MLIIPAVDIKNGKCVRLTQGKADSEIIYNESPVDAALQWQDQGAKYLHLVDLDGAFSGETANFDTIKEILSNINIPAEIGGGIRCLESIKKYIKMGANRVILGTKAIEDPDFIKQASNSFGNKIAVAIDARGSKVVVKGWVEETETTILDLAKAIEKTGVETVIYTDISTDGMLSGPNFEGIEKFVNNININTIISGGICSMDDISKIKQLNKQNITGIIIGKALYSGKLKGCELWTG